MKCKDPEPMLESLARIRGTASDRKLRLFACACCRAIWDRLGETSRHAVELAERFADGEAPAAELEAAQHGVWASSEFAFRAVAWRPGPDPVPFAVQASRWAMARVRSFTAAQAQRAVQAALLRDILGNPFRPMPRTASRLTPTVVQLARALYNERNFAELPILADALEEAGCSEPSLLRHCQPGGEHVRGCWVVDLVLGRG